MSKKDEEIMEALEAIEDLIKREAEALREKDPSLSEGDALAKVFRNREALYQGYAELHRRNKAWPRVEKRAELSLGPVAKELLEKKERLVQKSGGKLSEGEAYRKVFEDNPDLYWRYVEEVTLLTAV